MFPEEKIALTKENLVQILFKFTKIFKKVSGRHAKAELIFVGGASIIAKYS